MEAHRHSTASMIMRRFANLKSVILVGVALIVCKILWDSLQLSLSSTSVTFHDVDKVDFGKGLYAHGDNFYLDGKPFKILSGSFHYFRTRPSDWDDRLRKMKAAGLNTVTTYVPWNLHEPTKGQYVFEGDIDIVSFVKLAQNVGLHVIIRPGPYICAEWELGGLPAWLLKDPNMKLRTSYPGYMQHVEDYFGKLLPILQPLTYKRGGPIFAFQVENEYGSYGTDKDYLKSLVGLYKRFGIGELYFTSDGTTTTRLQGGSIPGILATANFKENQTQHLNELAAFQPNKPLMVTEFWPGWFDHWSEEHHGMTNEIFEKYTSTILEHGASINFYMFVGGTNFGFWNGANAYSYSPKYRSTITSYDYDAPVSEDGSLKEKYFITQKLLSKYSSTFEHINLVDEIKRTAYGTLDISQWLSYKKLTEFTENIALRKYGKELTKDSLVSMEQLNLDNGCGQNVGFLLYRTQVKTKKIKMLNISARVRDRVQIILNEQEIATFDRNEEWFPLKGLPQADGDGYSQLDLLVENLGRVNYLSLDNEHKGLLGTVYIDDEPIVSWKHIPMDFNNEFINFVTQKDTWSDFELESFKEHNNLVSPSLFMTNLDINSAPTDTYLDMFGWNKGVVFINGFNIGRYWRVGPQRTLYVPGSLLKQGRNAVVVFELHEPHRSIKFIDHSILNDKW